MLSFFPKCYEDELLYSTFARYHVRSGNRSIKSTLSDLFGVTSVCAVTDLPSHLQQVCRRIPGAVYSPDYFIKKHTLLPYYSPFLKAEQDKKIKEAMLGARGESIHMRVGLMASTVSVPGFLRYCPKCFIEDEKRVGEPFWHRAHQLPGVLLCPTHLTSLCDSDVSYYSRPYKQEFIPLSESRKKGNSNPAFTLEDSLHILYLATQSFLLLNYQFDPIGLDKLQRFYIGKLQEKDLASFTGRLRCKELVRSFVKFYGQDFLERLGSPINPEDEDTWLYKMLRKPRVSCHPLRHLLLLGYLGESASILHELPLDGFKPFGCAPWPCLNKAADHYRKPVVTNCNISRCTSTGKPIGTFSCDCGFIYTRKGPDKLREDRFKIGRVKAFGHIWEIRLRQLVEDRSLSLRRIAKELGVDPMTVKKYLESPKGIKENPSLEVTCEDMAYKLNTTRNDWLNQIESHPVFNRLELRRANPATYAWLYRNDREWLLNCLTHVNSKKISSMCQTKIDWSHRDRKLALLIEQESKNILKVMNKPIRISKTQIGKRIGQLALLENELDRLPLCKETLERVTESVEEFRARRVRLAASRLRNQGITLKRWRLVSEARLRPDFGSLVESVIAQELANHDNDTFLIEH